MHIDSDFIVIHKMLKERTKSVGEYLMQFVKSLRPISLQIIHMRNVDQKEWDRIVREVAISMLRTPENLHEFRKIDAIMQENTLSMKKIVAKHGGISTRKFGIVACHCAWLLVQHADDDVELQEAYLTIMQNNSSDYRDEYIKSLKLRVENHQNVLNLRTPGAKLQ